MAKPRKKPPKKARPPRGRKTASAQGVDERAADGPNGSRTTHLLLVEFAPPTAAPG